MAKKSFKIKSRSKRSWSGHGKLVYNMSLDMDMGELEKRFERAQLALDRSVMNSMVPFMPMQTGTFINITRSMSEAIAGSGAVVAAAPPYGRFLYEGMNMVDPETGSTYARAGAKKVLVSQYGGKTNARERLDFSHGAHPKAESHWFDAAKKEDASEWVRVVKANLR